MTDKHVKTLFISPIHYTVGQVCTAVAIHFVFKTTGVFSSSIQEYTLVMFSCLPFSWGGLNFEHSGCTECMLYYAKVYLPVFSLLLHCTVRMEAALNAPIQLAHVNHILKKNLSGCCDGTYFYTSLSFLTHRIHSVICIISAYDVLL